MWREGRPITVRGEYTLGSDRRDFLHVGVREPQVTTNPRIIFSCLRGGGACQNSQYQRYRTT